MNAGISMDVAQKIARDCSGLKLGHALPESLLSLVGPHPNPFTDKQIAAAARVLCRRAAEQCNVDFEDSWKVYGDDYLEDARAMFAAAFGDGAVK